MLTTKRAWFGGAIAAGISALAALGCQGEVRPAAGQLMIAVSSDMRPGRDFDDVRVIVADPRVSGEVVRGWRWDEAGAGPKLPGTVAVVGIPDGSGTPTTVRIEGWQRGVLRVVREARLVLPASGNFLLRTPVEWACLDVLPRRLAASDAVLTCEDGQTCIGGKCVAIDQQEALPTYSAALVFGGGEANGAGGQCFDVLATFRDGRIYTPENFSGPCGITFGGDPATTNVAVALGAGGAGFCAQDVCLVPLDRDDASGWSRQGARLVLPRTVCERSARVAVVTGAPAKTPAVPPCGEWSSVGVGTGDRPNEVIDLQAADAGAPVPDAALADAASTDAAANGGDDASLSADADVRDAGVVDGGAVDAGQVDAGCTPETEPQICQRLGAQCGSLTARDNCGVSRSIVSCGTCTSLGYSCAGNGTPNRCECRAESDTSFCARLQKNCGEVTGVDNCANSRTAASCGTCGPGETCGGAGVAGRCACAPESDASFCSRFGRCTAVSGTDKCGATRTNVNCVCGATDTCNVDFFCDASTPTITQQGTTALMSGDGLSNCGLASNEHCAASASVPSGALTFGTSATTTNASVTSLLVDRFEVTVGRFRSFVAAWNTGWRPSAGSGVHGHLNVGQGAGGAGGAFESGWSTAWNAYVGAPGVYAEVPTGAGATDLASWSSALACNGAAATWSASPGSYERAPQNCLSWFDLYAFCIWDGGFLPTELEWEYVAAGGTQDRAYPWGATPPGTDTSFANYGCRRIDAPPFTDCTTLASIAPVGSSPSGAGRWGHRDLAGNVFEWTLDWEGAIPSICQDCTNLTVSQSGRVVRGGAFGSPAGTVASAARGTSLRAAYRGADIGGRCARRL